MTNISQQHLLHFDKVSNIGKSQWNLKECELSLLSDVFTAINVVSMKLSLGSSKLGQILHLGIVIGPQRGEVLDQLLGIGEPLRVPKPCLGQTIH